MDVVALEDYVALSGASRAPKSRPLTIIRNTFCTKRKRETRKEKAAEIEGCAMGAVKAANRSEQNSGGSPIMKSLFADSH